MTSVLLVTPRWMRDGGVGTHVIASAAALAERGVQVGVLAAQIDPGQVPDGVAMFHSPRLFDHDAPAAERFGQAMAMEPEAVHLHQFDDPETARSMQRRAPVLLSAHGYLACTSGVHYFRPGHECSRAHGPGCIPRLGACGHTSEPLKLGASYRRATRSVSALRSADLAISYSSAVDRHLAVNGVERRRVVPLFSTMTPASGSGHATRRRVVFAGRVVLPKGIAVLIRAARSVEGEFVICGDGWRLEQMKRLAARLGVEERVHFRGWLDGPALAHELAEASVVVVPSIWPEPFGLVGIEAFAAGRPVVASATGGTGDWLEDGVNGRLVAPGDPDALAAALEQLLSRPDLQAEMGARGRELARTRFSAERHVEVLLESYRAAAANWRAGAGGA